MSVRILWVTSVRFQRSKGAEYEDGIGIGKCVGMTPLETVLDMTGNVVRDPVYNLLLSSQYGSFTVFDFQQPKKR